MERFDRRSGARSTASRTAAAARSPMACTASPIPAERPAAKSASSSSGDTRRMPASGVPQERGSNSAAVPEPSAPSAYSLAQPNRIVRPIFEGCARPQGALGGRRHRVGRDAERQAQTSVDEVPEIGERRVRVSKRGIGADAIAVGVVPRLAGAGHAEGGELAERRVEGVAQRSALEARHERRDQVHRGLAQDAGRLAAGPSLEAAAGRIRGLGAQAGKASGGR